MAKEYLNIDSLISDYPGAVLMIEIENQGQHPDAKFIKAVVGFSHSDNKEPDLMALYDCGTPGELLWVWVCGDITDPLPHRHSYIDEYYELPTEEAHKELNLL